MTFKRLWKAAGLIVLSFLLSRCSLEVGEKPPQNGQLAVQAEDFGCMSNVGEEITSYLRAKMSKTEINEFIRCLKTSLKSFTKYTRGEKERSYLPEELRGFLQRYFIDQKISDELLYEVMKIKKAVVGGTTKKVTRAELDRALEVLDIIREEALRLQPYMSVYNYSVGSQTTRSLDSFDRAAEVLRRSAQRLGKVLTKSRKSYPLDSFDVFLIEIRKFIKWEHYFQEVRNPETWAELVRTFKSFNVGPGREEVRPDEWPQILEAASGWYLVWLRYKYKVEGGSFWRGDGLNQLVAMMRDGLKLTHTSVESHPGKVIEYDRLGHLVDLLEKLEVLPFNVSANSLKTAFEPFFTRMLGDTEVPASQRETKGITRSTIARASLEFFKWADTQILLDSYFRAEEASYFQLSRRTQRRKDCTWFNPDEVLDFGCEKGHALGISIDNIAESMRPLFRDPAHGMADRVFLARRQELGEYGVSHNFYNLSIMNLIRSGVRLLIRGYSDKPWKMEGVSQEQLQKFYEDFKNLGVDLGVLEPQGTVAGKRSFLEGNLFTYAADGLHSEKKKDLLNFQETMELTAFLFSGGQLSKSLYDEILTVCHPQQKDRKTLPKGSLGEVQIERECFRRNLRSHLTEKIGNMPSMQEYLVHLPDAKWRVVEKLLLRMGSWGEDPGEWIGKSKINTFATILHYIETIMTRYNQNGDNQLDLYEVNKAYPIFKGVIELGTRKMGFELDNWQIKAVYHYIVTYGEVPGENALTRLNMASREGVHNASAFMYTYTPKWFKEWTGWKEPVGWRVHLDRLRLMCVFATFVDSAFGPPGTRDAEMTPQCPAFVWEESLSQKN